jgi:ATP-dependent RNA helicase DeaD
VIAPTRELALQVSRELVWLYGKAGARIATCVGGMDPSKERRALAKARMSWSARPAACATISSAARSTSRPARRRARRGGRDARHGLSRGSRGDPRRNARGAAHPALLGDHAKPIVALAKRYQRDALRISTVGEERGHGDIAYQAVTVAPSTSSMPVVNLLRLHEAETAMLFCATRDNVRRLHASLIERGFDAVALSGEHSQNERNAALQALRDRRARVCVATDVAARGIDLPTLSLVIHVELPRDAETLQHRSGRTGRAGKKGTAILLVPYPRRRRVDMMLRGAKIAAEWLSRPPRGHSPQ